MNQIINDKIDKKTDRDASQSFVLAYTKEQVAECMQVSISTVDNWMKEGLIKFSKIGRTVRFRKETLLDAMEKFETKYYDEQKAVEEWFKIHQVTGVNISTEFEVVPETPATLQFWAQQNMPTLLRYSAAWLDVSDKAKRPITRRMINKNLEYTINNTAIAKAWETEKGRRSIVAALKDSFYYGATLPEMGCIIPFGGIVEFIPDVEAFKFALTSGSSAPFRYLAIELIHENDKYLCRRVNGNFQIDFENIPAKRGEVIAVAVYGLNVITEKIEGELYEIEHLMEEVETHSNIYQHYLADLKLTDQKRVEGNLQTNGNREYYIKKMKREDGVGEWNGKTYIDEIRNPYIDTSRSEMLQKLAGETFCRPYINIRNAAELVNKWNDETDREQGLNKTQTTDNILNKTENRYSDQEYIKDTEIVEEEPEVERIW